MLTNENLFILSVVLISYLQFKIFITIKKKYTLLSTKQEAFIITFVSSSVMSTLSLISNYYFIKSNFDMEKYMYTPNKINEIVSVLSTATFMSTMIMDSLIGFLFYPEYMTRISGYPHHLFFIIGNMVVYYVDGYKIMSLFVIDELPTIIFSLGNINEKYRSDFLFGTLMMLVRIVYHGTLTLINITHTPTVSVAFPAWCMYIYWMRNWMNAQMTKISNKQECN